MLLTAPAHAACFVEYKAKQDNPLRLHYGILQIQGGCENAQKTKRVAQDRLGQHGWSLLNILSTSSKKPSSKKQENAGDNYLRY